MGRTLLSAAVAVAFLGSAVAVSGQGGCCRTKSRSKAADKVSAPHCVGPGIRLALDSGAAGPSPARKAAATARPIHRPGLLRNYSRRYVSFGSVGNISGDVEATVGALADQSVIPPGQRNARCGRPSSRPRQSLPGVRPPIEMSPGAPSRIPAAASNKLARAREHGR